MIIVSVLGYKEFYCILLFELFLVLSSDLSINFFFSAKHCCFLPYVGVYYEGEFEGKCT